MNRRTAGTAVPDKPGHYCHVNLVVFVGAPLILAQRVRRVNLLLVGEKGYFLSPRG